MPASCAAAAATARAARTSTRCCATSRNFASAIRSSTSSTASAATSASSRWISARVRPNSCSSSTRTTPSSTCRCRTCTSSPATAAPRPRPRRCTSSAAVNGKRPRSRAARQAHDTAAELLNLYAQRAARTGHAFTFTPHDYEAFADGFPFEETADQQAAIEAVITDLTAGRPMDRLVCGDVGFGKTEVALRAAFVALADGKQVAVLVPTTLLAEQHFKVFNDRFAEMPVRLDRALALPLDEGSEGGAGRPRRGDDRPRHRHAQAAAGRRELQEPRPRHHRRGAPLRRAPEGAAQEAARRGRRADADGDADPAHAGDVARGHPRLLGDRHGAAAAALDQDLRVDRTRAASSARLRCAS